MDNKRLSTQRQRKMRISIKMTSNAFTQHKIIICGGEKKILNWSVKFHGSVLQVAFTAMGQWRHGIPWLLLVKELNSSRACNSSSQGKLD